ncbi:MAG TPA: trehalose-phosphatase [Povalibacter sp.]|nr:trehalose-phosphatase [Povalibacter sp.]
MSIPIIPEHQLALFLDVDGTLLEIAQTPYAVIVPESLKITLDTLSSRLQGALALVSGRSVETLDALFAPYRFPAAGIHGCELRPAGSAIEYPAVDATQLAAARDTLSTWTQRHPGTLLEDKRYALALHYRLRPELETAALDAVLPVLTQLGGVFELQRGKSVYEIRPVGYTKGSAIHSFVRAAPFAGRTPLFIGDDITDESGFEVVNELGGVSVCVGAREPTAARYRLANVDTVISWLGSH